MKKTKELLEKLDNRIDEVKDSDEFKDMLRFLSKFHKYSYHNSILIHIQNQEATFVAGYKQWQTKFNRQVKKGEQGIAILAPFTYKKKVTEETEDGDEKETDKTVTKTYFRPVYVFDIAQTEGPPPPIIDISLQDNLNELLQPLVEFTTSKQEIKLKYKPLSEHTSGYSAGGLIVIDDNLNDTEKINVLLHELAHELLHYEGKDDLTREIKEMEAEAVSFVVLAHYKIESKSDKYLAMYKKTYDLKKSLDKISKVSSSIIDYCDRHINKKTDSDIKQAM